MKEKFQLLNSYIADIRSLTKCHNNDFILIGGKLHDLKENELYKIMDSKQLGRTYKNIEEFCKEHFNMQKSNCYNYINVCLKFGDLKSTIKKEYAAYNLTQLVEMLSLSEEELALVNSSMKKEDIRAIKKTFQPAGKNEEQDIDKIEEKYVPYLINFDKALFDSIRKYLKAFKGAKTIDSFVNTCLQEILDRVNKNT